jgi:hypothetical protein
MSKPRDHTGKTYGPCRVIGLAPGTRAKWLCECLVCGRIETRTAASVRDYKRRPHTNCAHCRPSYVTRTKEDIYIPDVGGTEWNGKQYVSTPIGLLRQQFYLGLMTCHGLNDAQNVSASDPSSITDVWLKIQTDSIRGVTNARTHRHANITARSEQGETCEDYADLYR